MQQFYKSPQPLYKATLIYAQRRDIINSTWGEGEETDVINFFNVCFFKTKHDLSLLFFPLQPPERTACYKKLLPLTIPVLPL